MIYVRYPELDEPIYLTFSTLLAAANYLLDEQIYEYEISTKIFDYTDVSDYSDM